MPSSASINSGHDDDGGAGAGAGGKSWSQDVTVAKAVGFVVFSGIAVSIVKTLVSKPGQPERSQTPLQDFFKPMAIVEEGLGRASSSDPSGRIVKIEKGDTLWGLSRKYGVSIDAIKEANGISGNTIYAGRKLVIP